MNNEYHTKKLHPRYQKYKDRLFPYIVCYTCKNEGHTQKECIFKEKFSKIKKEKTSKEIEEYVVNNITCLNCLNPLRYAKQFLPSVDVICTNCNKPYEIKSKAMSRNVLPEYIKLDAGEYTQFGEKINDENLFLIFIVYRINEKLDTKEIYAVKYIDNITLKRAIKNGKSKLLSNGASTGNNSVMIEYQNTKAELNEDSDIHILQNKSKSLIVIPSHNKYTHNISLKNIKTNLPCTLSNNTVNPFTLSNNTVNETSLSTLTL